MINEENASLRALVVDDNEVNTMILSNMLEVFNLHSDQANHGMDAVLMSQKTPYDIIFVDHVMPEMDGAQTTKAIRNISTGKKETVIIALTSYITEQVKNLYWEAGANDIYEKPLGLVELASILKIWCPNAQIDNITINQKTDTSDENNELIKATIEKIDDIDYTTGLKYAIGNPVQFINMLEVSLKDLQQCNNIIINSREKNSVDQLRIGVHNLRSVFSNIGARYLSEDAGQFEKIILQGNIAEINAEYKSFSVKLENFGRKLQYTLESYYVSKQKLRKVKEQTYVPMSKEEYEQCLSNTIYYIRRFEYDAIIRELERLILHGSLDAKQEFEMALSNIKNFDYEKALRSIIKIKNETIKDCPEKL